jgi:hypothetical protein
MSYANPCPAQRLSDDPRAAQLILTARDGPVARHEGRRVNRHLQDFDAQPARSVTAGVTCCGPVVTGCGMRAATAIHLEGDVLCLVENAE